MSAVFTVVAILEIDPAAPVVIGYAPRGIGIGWYGQGVGGC